MEPLIRNIKDFPAGEVARLISADDDPFLTLAYSVIQPGGTSSHHIHEWEHEVYIIEGSGTLVADGKEYPVKAGDAMFIPPMVDHVTRNDGDSPIHRIEINPISAASGNARPGGSEPGAGTPPVIRNHADLNDETGHTMLGGRDGCPNYLMLYNGYMQPGAV
ncbi:MAG: cupin domain-containing protein, partial [Chloroflexi bacterium]|nr:cupin domain-containing protein [Chloroflexota bacterium]